jgi:GGDEF domain-containing protein
MTDQVRQNIRGIGYTKARRLVLGTGFAVLLLTAGVMYARRVETVEVVATLLFMIVMVGFVFWKLKGGISAGIAATLAYIWLRYPAVEAVGLGGFAGLILSRAIAYTSFGAIGGWANRRLEASVVKLELYDQVDDLTGVFNARFFLQDTDLEISRSRRYQTLFSVAVADIPQSALEPLSHRQRTGAIRQLAQGLRLGVRSVDRVVHGSDGNRHRLAVVLPETGAEGARVFTDRLVTRVAGNLAQRGADINGNGVEGLALSFPEDAEGIQNLRQEFSLIEQMEHPEAVQSS